MSHCIPDSKARMLAPLTVSASFSSRIRWMSSASWARNRSPRPVTFMSGAPSPVSAFLRNFPMPPEPWYSKFIWPW
jgi:hypothetical protein